MEPGFETKPYFTPLYHKYSFGKARLISVLSILCSLETADILSWIIYIYGLKWSSYLSLPAGITDTSCWILERNFRILVSGSVNTMDINSSSTFAKCIVSIFALYINLRGPKMFVISSWSASHLKPCPWLVQRGSTIRIFMYGEEASSTDRFNPGLCLLSHWKCSWIMVRGLSWSLKPCNQSQLGF